jgi:hypothetical protein
MSSIILLIFEGEKTEPMIFDNIRKLFFNESSPIVIATFKAEIYQLWKEINNDEYLDTIELLKEKGNSHLQEITRDQIAEIHLFFDHDAHSHLDTMKPQEYNKLIRTMIHTFNNEQEQGKLWISYPMVEALKHGKKDAGLCFEHCIVDISKNNEYKELIGKISDYLDIRKFKDTDWYYFIALNAQKIYCLINGVYKVPTYQEIKDLEQNIIHEKQVERFIIPEGKVVVLSAFPAFLLYYFGEEMYKKIDRPVVKNCQFRCLCSSL